MKISRVLPLRCSGSFRPGDRVLLLQAEDLMKSSSSKMIQKANFCKQDWVENPLSGESIT